MPHAVTFSSKRFGRKGPEEVEDNPVREINKEKVMSGNTRTLGRQRDVLVRGRGRGQFKADERPGGRDGKSVTVGGRGRINGERPTV